MNTTDDQNPYQATFIEYVISGVQEALDRVRAANPLPNEHDRQFAWHILSYAFNFDEAWPFTRELLLALAPKMEQAGFREDWMLYLEQGRCQSQALNDEIIAAECQLQIGMLYRLQSKFDLARQQLTASVAGFAALHAAHDQARALNELAWLDHLQHRYAEATQHVEVALALLNDEDLECAMCYRVLAMVATVREQWQEAEVLHRKALAIFEKHDNKRHLAWGLQNLGIALSGAGKFEEAIELYLYALAILEKLGDIQHWAVAQMNLGTVYYRNGALAASTECHAKAEIVFNRLYDRLNLARNFANIGLTCLAQHDHINAEVAFQASINLYGELGNIGWQLNAMDGLAMTFLECKDYDKAISTIEYALAKLPQIIDTPNYPYLIRSLNEHLGEAKLGKRLQTQ